MADNIFQSLRKLSGQSTGKVRKSVDWFRNKVSDLSLGGLNRRALLHNKDIVTKEMPLVGRMGVFYYDPKHKDTLPYYDRFPLVIMIGPAKGGFYGLNLHYLPPILRARFLDRLLDFTDDNSFDVTYKMLKATSKLRYFEPCYKHYLTKQVEGKLAYIPPPEWEIATFLPAAQWQKGGRSQAYSDARKMI
jgi:hypothetical protein